MFACRGIFLLLNDKVLFLGDKKQQPQLVFITRSSICQIQNDKSHNQCIGVLIVSRKCLGSGRNIRQGNV